MIELRGTWPPKDMQLIRALYEWGFLRNDTAHSKFMDPARTKTLSAFNDAMRHVARQQTTATSSIVAVDMCSNWSDSYMDGLLHYNKTGAKGVADRYFAAMLGFFR